MCYQGKAPLTHDIACSIEALLPTYSALLPYLLSFTPLLTQLYSLTYSASFVAAELQAVTFADIAKFPEAPSADVLSTATSS